MSTRAAITAAPTKKLTTSAPQAGVVVTAPRRHQRVGDRPVAEPEQHGGDRAQHQQPRAGGREHLHLRVGGREGEDHAGERHRRAGARSARRPRQEPRQDRRSRAGGVPSGTGAPAAASARSRPAPAVRANGCRRPPEEGEPGRDVRQQPLGLGHHQHQAPSAAAARARPGQSTAPARTGPTSVPTAASVRRMTAASTSPTARLIQKIVRQLAEGEHHGAVHRADDVAELLHGADQPERHATAPGRVQVGHEGEVAGSSPPRRRLGGRARRPAPAGRTPPPSPASRARR